MLRSVRQDVLKSPMKKPRSPILLAILSLLCLATTSIQNAPAYYGGGGYYRGGYGGYYHGGCWMKYPQDSYMFNTFLEASKFASDNNLEDVKIVRLYFTLSDCTQFE